MTLIQAMQTNHFVKRPNGSPFRYCLAGTGPFADLVGCDYFVIREDGAPDAFSTSIDLYPEDILATDYELA